jgi:hypothetical protein
METFDTAGQVYRGADDRDAAPMVGDVHLRNHDFERGYDIELVVYRDEEVVFSERYYARPGWSRSVQLGLSAGTYDVLVTLDNDQSRREPCRIGPAPVDSVLVECGNGSVTLSRGIY